MNRPVLNFLLFLASMIITGSLIFGISGCSKEQEPAPATQTVKTETKPLPPVSDNLPMAVDFDNVPLSELVQFVTSQTGRGVVLSGSESLPITWIESNLTKETLFASFQSAVKASGLLLEPGNEQGTLYTVKKPEEPKTAVLLDYARSSRGVFFLLGSTIFPLEKFPYPVRYDSGHWYALLPKSIAASFSVTQSSSVGNQQD